MTELTERQREALALLEAAGGFISADDPRTDQFSDDTRPTDTWNSLSAAGLIEQSGSGCAGDDFTLSITPAGRAALKEQTPWEKPLPCPWCGTTSHLLFSEATVWGRWEKFARVDCLHPSHLGAVEGPVAQTNQIWIDWSTPVPEAVEAWNVRAALTAALEGREEPDATAYSDAARAQGVAEGRLRVSETAGIIDGWRERAERAEAEVAHWKANHADMVARNAVLRDRPDLPADRLPALARLEAALAAKEQECERLRDRAERVEAALAAMSHVANEWADAATSAPDMLKNVRDGIGTVSEYLTLLAKQFEHCRALWTEANKLAASGGGNV